MAARVSLALLQKPADVQALLAQHLMLQNLFNGGVFVVAEDGTTIADMPVATGRLGTNYLDNPDSAAIFKDGQSRIGRPTLGRVVNQPVIGEFEGFGTMEATIVG